MSDSQVDAERVRRARDAAQLLEHPLLREAAQQLEAEQLERSIGAERLEDREEARMRVVALRQVFIRLRRHLEDIAVRPVRRAS